MDQPPPKPGHGDIWQLTIADMEARRLVGIERYQTPLQAHNGRDALMDAFLECLDMAAYLRQAIEERRAADVLILTPGQLCQYEDCTEPATCVAVGRDTHQTPGFYCAAHGHVVWDEGGPEYHEACPNCGCWFGGGN